jgi:glucose/arabinose dehydrogenase
VWYVEKATGRIRIRDLDDDSDRLFFTVPGVDASGERGMLGIALHPRFPRKPFVYAYATRTVGGKLRNQIVRLRDDAGRGAHLRVLFSAPASANAYHNGGHIGFGPDGMLYAVVGDGHDASNAQRLSDERGKVLRMTPGGRAPRSNPFRHSLVWAYGIRNSFGLAFDPITGDLWETENGPACNDELNRIRRGRNFGWGPHETCDGTSPGNTNQDGPRPELPERWYTPTIAPTGAAFCDRCRLGRRSEGSLFFGAYNTGEIRRAILTPAGTHVRRQSVVLTHPEGIFSMQAAPDGTLFFSDPSGIYRLTRS